MKVKNHTTKMSIQLFPEFVERIGRKFNIPENEWYDFDLEIQDGFNRKLETLQI